MKTNLLKKLLSVSVTLIFALNVFALSVNAATKNDEKLIPIGTYKNSPEAKHQLISGPCWAFAGIATLEMYLAKNNMLDKSLSEKHLLNWARQGISNPGWDIPITDGGFPVCVMAYFSSKIGAVYSEDVPYNTEDTVYTGTNAINPRFVVNGIKYIEPNIKDVKDAIIKYGAVASAYINPEHAISIIGWNDKTRQWLIKDSLAKENYRWISYSTPGILTSSLNYCITDAKPFNENEKIYQYDKYGAIDHVQNANTLICANIFDFSTEETLDSIMLESVSSGSEFSIYYAPVRDRETIETDKTNWILLKSGIVPYNGYFTSSLDNKITLPNGPGAIIVKMENGENPATIGCQSAYLFLNIGEENSKSFIFQDGIFKKIQDINSMRIQGFSALSIKAIIVNKL